MKHLFIINPAAGSKDQTAEYTAKIQETFADREDAYEIVSNHWRMQDGDSEGACGTTLVSRIVILEKPNVDTMSYRICFQVEAYGHANHGWESQIPTITIYDELLVNAITGECVDINEVSADGK